MNELFAWAQFLRLVSLGDGRRKISQPIVRHAERELRVKIFRVLREHLLQLGDS